MASHRLMPKLFENTIVRSMVRKLNGIPERPIGLKGVCYPLPCGQCSRHFRKDGISIGSLLKTGVIVIEDGVMIQNIHHTKCVYF